MTRPRVLVVAGLDPTGGAGLVADLEALSAVGATGWAVASALTAQGPGALRPGRARGIRPTTPDFLEDQIDALLGGAERPAAVKTGMLGTAALVAALADRLRARPFTRVPLVVDPVLLATSGLPLLERGSASFAEVLAPLLARARVATPNLPELALLTGLDVSTEAAAVRAARLLPSRAVVVKGGHAEGEPADLLVEGRRVSRLTGRRRPGTARGTGCRFASALAGLLARGEPLEVAARGAKRVVERYLDGR
ncbi:MAG: hydroxymethylpyrimidine/phosphomethylpyrimidine kinase [Anaeromyxobacteraceae bacterium]